MRVLVACEYSGAVRRAFRARGHEAWSCDLLPAEDDSEFHIQGNVLYSIGSRYHRRKPWDLMIAHPPCTRLTNSGVRWLSVPPPGRTLESMWTELGEAAAFYKALREAPIRLKAIENPIMHGHARALLGDIKRHIVQPWWFGDPAFKATGWELHGLPPLVPTNKLVPPAKDTDEWKRWSAVHRASPGPDRWKDRSRTLPGSAAAMAAQWG